MPTEISGSTGVDKIQSDAIETGDLPAGSVLQVVSATTQDYFTTTSTSWVTVTGLSVNITPSSTSSKILVMLSAGGTSAGDAGYISVFRDSTNLVNTRGSRYPALLNTYQGGWAGNFKHTDASILDSPSTTSQITYSVKAGLRSGGTTAMHVGTSRAGDTNNVDTYTPFGTITVMEIAG